MNEKRALEIIEQYSKAKVRDFKIMLENISDIDRILRIDDSKILIDLAEELLIIEPIDFSLGNRNGEFRMLIHNNDMKPITLTPLGQMILKTLKEKDA